MDVVSDAITAVRVGRPSSDRMRVDGSWCVRFAPYDGAGFHVVLEGGCWLLPDGGPPVSLVAGDAVLLPHGTGHVIADSPADARAVARALPFESVRGAWRRTGPKDDGTAAGAGGTVEMLCGKYRLDRSRAHPLMAELPPVVHLPNRVGSHPELRSAIDLLGRELGGQRPGGGVAVPSLLDLLLVYMIRSWLTAEGTAGSWPAVLGDPVAAAALRALHADPAAPWTNERLAAEAGVSRPTLARRFTALVGRPPMAYLTWWRLNLAAGLLRGTEDPLAAVARRVGYGTPYALSHAFSREFGTTPGRYRAGEPAGVPHAEGRAARTAGAARGPGTPRTAGAAPAG
ncbi:AraC family transcriptional regulator [Streptomyces sp. WAC07061]|uniref:AraC family transcriptional regulator n=1 Tax=Streptomyces sp. WAC07061 TaxID=2487410 RepID=UPI000F78B8A3|nr:AraC family transcriptional regulator [Streptomyces sp. WAC07061]RSS58178.1 AraC family transcriptional regulator [Streptomyces sp. WAC07061]